MRTSLRAAAAALAFTAATSLPAAAQSASPTKIAYVNPQALLQNAPGRAEAEATLQKEVTTAQEQMKRMTDSLNAMVVEYQKAQATLTTAQRETREKSIRSRQEAFQKRQQSLEEQFGQRQQTLMSPIMEQVRKALEDIRAEEGFAVILSHEPGNSPILAADKNLDITERVVARLKTLGAPSPATTTTRPQGPASAPSGVTRPKSP
jgi:outer membrane protein